jgi:DMSO/TMAO reductase YedYZ molybdopterin-dependent catalytic subunit
MAAADDTPPEDSKLTRTKRKWAAEGRGLTGDVGRPETGRLPPGQHRVNDWPVLDLGQHPAIAPDDWRLVIGGAVENPLVWGWDSFRRQPQSRKTSDIHCVTSWSRYDNRWDGVAARDLLDIVMPKADAGFVVLHGQDGYTTNLTIEDFAAEDVLLAHSWEGRPLSREHGGPVRLVLPALYFWKSPKWLRHVWFTDKDVPGTWEARGYHRLGDPWRQQRYG